MELFLSLFGALSMVAQVGAYPAYDRPPAPLPNTPEMVYASFLDDLQALPTSTNSRPPSDTTAERAAIDSAVHEVIDTVLERYPFQQQINAATWRRMKQGAVAGVVAALEDPYSTYIPPRSVSDVVDSLEASFVGIGAQVEESDGRIIVVTPLRESPAERAGLLPGDIIVSVDDEPVVGQSVHEVVDLIRGPAGTLVELEVARENEMHTLRITRRFIDLPEVTLTYHDNVPVLGIHQFTTETAQDVREIINAQLTPAPDALIIDVRSNPGGYVQSALDVAEFFLEPGQDIMRLRYRDTSETFAADRMGELTGVNQLIVLQNGGTASASEILAGALRDQQDAVLVGDTSFGKGIMQEFVPLSDGVLKLTVAGWYTPSGQWVSAIPLQPEVSVTNDEDPETDEILDAALALVSQ